MAIKYYVETIATIGSTEMNNLPAGSGVLCAEYNNASNLHPYALIQLEVDFATAPTADSLILVYAVTAPDGTNYADNARPNHFIGSFVVANTANAQRLVLGVGGGGAYGLIPIPPCKFKIFIQNNTNQPFPASGSTLKLVAFGLNVV